MANNYTSFSFQVKCPSEEAAKILEDSLGSATDADAEADTERWLQAIRSRNATPFNDAGAEADDERWLSLEHAEAEGDTVWIASEEGTDLEYLADVLQDYLQNNDPEGSIGFTWANTCSKLWVDEFGGGAVFITAEDQVWLSASHWLQTKEDNHTPAPAPTPST